MLIVDLKRPVPVDVTRMDWNKSHVSITEGAVAIPLSDMAVSEAAEPLAYDLASRQPWTWPDRDNITVALVCDTLRSFPRFSLRVGVRPAQCPEGEAPEEWAEFEAQRREAIRQFEQNGGGDVYDLFPVMLSQSEEEQVRRLLFEELGFY